MLSKLWKLIFGTPINPLHPKTGHRIALIAFFAWIGLGANTLSSVCYGPEEAFIALGTYHHLAVYVAAITIITIFIISIGYNQVIELFPSGGGYKVASKLLHPYAGLVSGAALIVDYVLTITVSVASGADAMFNLVPLWLHDSKLYIEALAILLLLAFNLRGVKGNIQVIFPIFIGFVVLHVCLIIYGIIAHAKGLTNVTTTMIQQSHQLAETIGWLSVIGLVLHAYSLGSGTFTGLETVSNNIQGLAEPRIATGKRTMLYMATSLSILAGGIILLYLLWAVTPVAGKTLNALVFHSILGDSWWGRTLLMLTLAFEAGLLLVAANTGFVDGPNVLANMAVDGWLPNRFRHLSYRLVTQNGLALLGIASLVILFIAGGSVAFLVVLYSINVFITFSLSLLSISVYWFTHRLSNNWIWHFLLSSFACITTTAILSITIFYKFSAGGWVTLAITFSLVMMCLFVHRHYQYIAKTLARQSRLLQQHLTEKKLPAPAIDPKQPTAIIFINNLSVGMHTLLSVIRLFPELYKNFVFISAGVVDVESFRGEQELRNMQANVNSLIEYFVKFCHQNGYPAEGFSAFGTDAVEELKMLSDEVGAKYPHGIFFASQLIFKQDNMITRFLHNQTPLIIQDYLHLCGRELMILPMRI